MTHTAAPPDVCKTPSPGGPVPIPYVNVAMDSDITDGAETVKIEGNPVANVAAKISTSTGDEAGSAGGGILSSKIKGTVTWKMGSLDVKAEGKSVVRFLDTGFHNGNSFNTSFIAQGGTGVAYADDFTEPCPICGKGADEHKILEKGKPPNSTAEVCAKIVKELKEKLNGAAENAKGKYAKVKNGKYGVYFGGYMVGVMICKGHEQKFAAMSGTYVLEGFREVAGNNGCTVVGGGSVGPADLDSANTSGAQPEPPATRLSVIRDAFAATTANFERGQRLLGSKNPYSKPGTCAGAHLIAKSGHAPAWMTEMYFAPTSNWTKGYNWRVEGLQQANRIFGTNVHSFTPWGNTVASCHSCQELLFLAMCPKRTC
jgi:hypothetical protein